MARTHTAPGTAPATASATARATAPTATAVLWFGMLAGPVAALVLLQVDYMIVPAACDWTTPVVAFTGLHLVAVLMLAVTAHAGRTAWRHLGRAREAERPGEGDTAGRVRFMAQVGVGTSALFLLVLLAEWIPVFIIHPCQYV